MVPYLVSVFEKDTLSNLVRESFGSDFPDILQKRQISYMFRYLKDLKAASIVLEFDYLDRDYLEDYSRYYVKRFSANGSKCARLHFFSKKVDHGMIERALACRESKAIISDLQSSYLGYVVIKPLPKTFIGRTCLRKYSSIGSNSGAKKAISRPYNVDLFGIRLTVDSVAFQEQDKIVSACATTAIWSSIHATTWRPVRNIPACSEITINAINHIEGSSNSFPSKELSNKQMLRALDVEGYRNHYQSLDEIDQSSFIKIVKYHIDSGLPLILGADVYKVVAKNDLQLMAGHAVTVLGYKISDRPALYIHDDRLGPYARATFVNLSGYECSANKSIAQKWALVLQEKDDSGDWKPAHEVLVPKSLIIPTHKKVRLPYNFADTTCKFIQGEFENWLTDVVAKDSAAAAYQNQLHYNVRLAEISEIRQEVINFDFSPERTNINDLESLKRDKIDFLTTSYARFHWVAEFIYGNNPAFTVLFDATDIPQGDAVAGIFVKDREKTNLILTIFRQYAEKINKITVPQTENFYVSFLKRLRKSDESYNQHLDDMYGELRAPAYLKATEIKDGEIAHNKDRKKYYSAVEQALDEVIPQLIPNETDSYWIWAVAYDGALLLGPEVDKIGHPGLTGFKPARIAGELRRTSTGWTINSKSGRYSKDYSNANHLLKNAVEKFNMIFHKNRGSIVASYF
jgi:hypothetical protein